jgi:hypothetical protein
MKILQVIISIFIFSILWKNCHSQIVTYPNLKDSTIIQIKEFYEGYGKIFDSKNILNKEFFSLCLLSPVQTFNLSNREIIQAEELFLSNYGLNGKNKSKHSLRKNVKKFSNFYRQYVCYLNKKGEREVQIIFLSVKIISASATDSDYFIRADWKVCPQYGHGFSNNEMFRYWVNLDTGVMFVKFH